MLATHWNESMDPVGWWMSEKYDGIRAYWNGTTLISRNGNVITPPSWFYEKLPKNIELDGELWISYGKYREAVKLAKSNKDQFWKGVKYIIFDYVDYTMPCEKRLEHLKSLNIENEFVEIAPQEQCRDMDHFKRYYESILNRNGEGIMLRKSGSLYKSGRSPDLRKYKGGILDTEVRFLQKVDKGFLCQQYVFF